MPSDGEDESYKTSGRTVVQKPPLGTSHGTLVVRKDGGEYRRSPRDN